MIFRSSGQPTARLEVAWTRAWRSRLSALHPNECIFDAMFLRLLLVGLTILASGTYICHHYQVVIIFHYAGHVFLQNFAVIGSVSLIVALTTNPRCLHLGVIAALPNSSLAVPVQSRTDLMIPTHVSDPSTIPLVMFILGLVISIGIVLKPGEKRQAEADVEVGPENSENNVVQEYTEGRKARRKEPPSVKFRFRSEEEKTAFELYLTQRAASTKTPRSQVKIFLDDVALLLQHSTELNEIDSQKEQAQKKMEAEARAEVCRLNAQIDELHRRSVYFEAYAQGLQQQCIGYEARVQFLQQRLAYFELGASPVRPCLSYFCQHRLHVSYSGAILPCISG